MPNPANAIGDPIDRMMPSPIFEVVNTEEIMYFLINEIKCYFY
jgi:hypothetical protein